jgi:cytochrome c peroxidase
MFPRHLPGRPLPSRGFRAATLVILAASLAPLAGACGAPAPADPSDPPEVTLGKRLFRETRFAQLFAARAGDDMNRRLEDGDTTVAVVKTPAGSVPGPYRGSFMNCAGCHLSDELQSQGTAGLRSFADFEARSPIPARSDGRSTTTRNTAALVDLVPDGAPAVLLHADGEFASPEALVEASLVGRNLGWEPGERQQALAHVARVIREDDGSGALAREAGGLPYRTVFASSEPATPPGWRLPESLRLDVAAASDDQILAALAKVVARYLRSLSLARDLRSDYRGSPYDRFLAKNGLPARPAPGETATEYGQRLYTLLATLAPPAFVSEADGRFTRHEQRFVFGPLELRGLQTFLGRPGEAAGGPPGVWACATCHPPPHFTDFGFHNTGVTQIEYDTLHGPGSFAALAVPGLAERRQNEDAFLPPSARRPDRRGPFRAAPARDRPGDADLGVWNMVGNPDAAAVEPALQQALCPLIVAGPGPCDLEELLPLTIASFKTRGLRNLGHSGPYFHDGRAATLEDTVSHYMIASLLLANNQLRSGDIAIEWLEIGSGDIAPLAAFLRALNED